MGVSSPADRSSRRRWLALGLAGVLLLLFPVIFMEQIGQAVAAALAAAQHNPALVAALLIAALALDVFLPVPNGVVNTLAGAIFGLYGGTAVIWTGMMAASLLGYATGAMAAKPLARRLLGDAELAAAHRFAERLGPAVLILTRPVPIIAELATMAAGMAAMPLGLFVLLSALANLIVAIIYAAVGAAAIASQTGELAVIGCAVLPLLAWLGYRWWDRRTA